MANHHFRSILRLWRNALERRRSQFSEQRNAVAEQASRQALADAAADRRFRDLLEAAPDAILEIDVEGKIVLVNAEAERTFGYDRAELLGRSIELLVPEASRSRHATHRANYGERPSTRPMGSG